MIDLFFLQKYCDRLPELLCQRMEQYFKNKANMLELSISRIPGSEGNVFIGIGIGAELQGRYSRRLIQKKFLEK